ncbi:hypothetical protein Pcinc_040937, partial [Petrolisthes cinctipes]
NSTTALTKGTVAGGAGSSAGAAGGSLAGAAGGAGGAAGGGKAEDGADAKDSAGRPLVPVNKNLGNVKAEHGAHPSYKARMC